MDSMTGIKINDLYRRNEAISNAIVDITLKIRKEEYQKMLEYEKDSSIHYLPMGVMRKDWEEFRAHCTDKELKEFFGIKEN